MPARSADPQRVVGVDPHGLHGPRTRRFMYIYIYMYMCIYIYTYIYIYIYIVCIHTLYMQCIYEELTGLARD